MGKRSSFLKLPKTKQASITQVSSLGSDSQPVPVLFNFHTGTEKHCKTVGSGCYLCPLVPFGGRYRVSGKRQELCGVSGTEEEEMRSAPSRETALLGR